MPIAKPVWEVRVGSNYEGPPEFVTNEVGVWLELWKVIEFVTTLVRVWLET